MRATVEDEAVTTLVRDRRLLKRYVRDGSEDAFHEIVRRHIRLVYATCLRELGDPSLAEDATQIVFLILSRKAPALSLNQSLAGWLFITSRYTAIDLRRREVRRREIESEIEKQARDSIRYEDFAWGFIDPNLNDALMSLGTIDRQALLLRFFDQRTFKEVGQHLSITEAAAERRVSRALTKMRRQLVNAGFAVSISALFALLQERAAEAVPAHCLTKTLHIASAANHATSVTLLAKSAVIGQKMASASRVARLKLAACVAASIIAAVASEHRATRAHRAPTVVTLSSPSGKRLWNFNSPRPQLTLSIDENRRATLINGRGQSLWSGVSPDTPSGWSAGANNRNVGVNVGGITMSLRPSRDVELRDDHTLMWRGAAAEPVVIKVREPGRTAIVATAFSGTGVPTMIGWQANVKTSPTIGILKGTLDVHDNTGRFFGTRQVDMGRISWAPLDSANGVGRWRRHSSLS